MVGGSGNQPFSGSAGENERFVVGLRGSIWNISVSVSSSFPRISTIILKVSGQNGAMIPNSGSMEIVTGFSVSSVSPITMENMFVSIETTGTGVPFMLKYSIPGNSGRVNSIGKVILSVSPLVISRFSHAGIWIVTDTGFPTRSGEIETIGDSSSRLSTVKLALMVLPSISALTR